MPSKVTLIAPLGNPLIVELRGFPGVSVPGCVTINSTALRVANGSEVSCLSVSVLVISAEAACTTSAPLCTVTVSVAWPTSSLVGRLVGSPAVTRTLEADTTLNPGLVTLTRNKPASSSTMLHWPFSSELALNTWSVVTDVTVISAPGTAAPLGSVMVPSIRPIPCEKARAAHRHTSSATIIDVFIFGVYPLSSLKLHQLRNNPTGPQSGRSNLTSGMMQRRDTACITSMPAIHLGRRPFAFCQTTSKSVPAKGYWENFITLGFQWEEEVRDFSTINCLALWKFTTPL